MTPRQKAQELVFDMEQRIEQNCNQSSREAHYSAAKQCAMIAVSQIINLPVFWDGTTEGADKEGDENFWVNVKDEIQKL